VNKNRTFGVLCLTIILVLLILGVSYMFTLSWIAGSIVIGVIYGLFLVLTKKSKGL